MLWELCLISHRARRESLGCICGCEPAHTDELLWPAKDFGLYPEGNGGPLVHFTEEVLGPTLRIVGMEAKVWI